MFSDEPLRAHLLRLYVSLSAVALVFAVWPQIDLWASALFWTPAEGFWIESTRWAQMARETIWALILGVFAMALLGFGWSLLRPGGAVPARIWGLILALYLLGPVLLVNALLKQHWGRARPADVEIFGGSEAFTPPFQMAGPCADNCAFVSGEGAGASALALALLWLVPALPRRGLRHAVVAVAAAICVAGLSLRLAMGRHFLSDTIFALLFVWAIWSLLGRALPAGWRARAAGDPAAGQAATPTAPGDPGRT